MTRWLEGDERVKLAGISEYAARHAEPAVRGAEDALRKRLLPRGPLIRQLPKQSAWSTMETLIKQARERSLARQKRKNEKKRRLGAVGNSPGKNTVLARRVDMRAARIASLHKATLKLRDNTNSLHQMEAVSELLALHMSLSEARDLKADEAMRALFSNARTQLHVKLAARQLLDAWSDEKKIRAASSNQASTASSPDVRSAKSAR